MPDSIRDIVFNVITMSATKWTQTPDGPAEKQCKPTLCKCPYVNHH